jgi:adenine-specific DNA methylase
MKLAILFWFYKEPQVCKNHLELLRRYNPTVPIYGLYGDELGEVHTYKSVLSKYLDDFYAFTQDKSSSWKWHLGDLLITDWYLERGQHLTWDTIFVVQWDMLVFGPVNELFSMLKEDQILLSGLRPIKEVEKIWSWTSPTITLGLDCQNYYLIFEGI